MNKKLYMFLFMIIIMIFIKSDIVFADSISGGSVTIDSYNVAPGTLQYRIESRVGMGYGPRIVTELYVTADGEFNSDDIAYINSLAKLEVLHVSSSVVVGNVGDSFCSSYQTSNFDNLRDVIFPATGFGNKLFTSCENLESVFLPNAESFGMHAFIFCDSLEKVSLPKAKTFTHYAFWGCKSLKSLSLPEAETFGFSSFAYCYSLQRLILPQATLFGTDTFNRCNKLTSLVVGDIPPTVAAWGSDLATNRTVIVPLNSYDNYDNVSLPNDDGLWEGWIIEKNIVPKRKDGISAISNISISLGKPYVLDLTTIFEDDNNEPLEFKVAIDGGDDKILSDNIYTYTPTVLGSTTHVFSVSDGTEYSTDTYEVTLVSVSDYVVTFNGNGATSGSMENQNFMYDTSQNLTVNDYERIAYTFAGWATSANGDVLYIDEQEVTNLTTSNNVSLYAKWEKITYDITYNLNGGTNSSSNPTTYDVESEDITLANPTRAGYTFGGWYEDSNFTGSVVTTIPQGSIGNKIMYAKWIPTEYIITYNLNGGTNSSSNPATYNIESEEIIFANPTKAGYTFDRWYSDINLTIPFSSIPSGSTGNMDIYVKWEKTTYNITYNLNGGTNNSSNPATYDVESAEIIFVNPLKVGYTFGGWYSDIDYTMPCASILEGSIGNKEVHANWTPSTGTAYKVNHYKQNIENDDYTLGLTETLFGTTNQNAIATVKIFKGFTENQSHSSRVNSGAIKADGSLVLSLYYDRNIYEVDYNSNGGNNIPSQTNIKYDSIISKPNDPIRSGYVFVGWYEDSNLTQVWDFDNDTVTEDKVLYANWTPSTGTAYRVNHYKQNIENDDYTLGLIETLYGTTNQNTIATVKIFKGFTENQIHSSRVNSGAIKADGSLVLSLYYDRNTYDVSYDSNGGNNIPSQINIKYDSSISKPNDPIRNGYVFVGWYENSELTQVWDFDNDTVTEDNVLYANWTPSTGTAYRVNHYKQNIENDEYTLGLTETLYGTTNQNAVATVKVFEGFTENQSHISRVNNGSIKADGSLVLSLYYDRNTYDVNFDSNGADSIATQTGIKYDATILQPSNPSKQGYKFNGWYKDENLTNAWDYAINRVTQDITLYAKWTMISSSISPSPSKEKIKDVEVIVDGENKTNEAVVKKKVVNGKVIVQVDVKSDKIIKDINGDGKTLNISSLGNVSVIETTLRQNILESKTVTDIKIKSESVTYELPFEEINHSSVEEAVGEEIEKVDDITISIKKMDSLDTNKILEKANLDKSQIVFELVEFEIMAKVSTKEGKSKTIKLEKFDNYVDRIMEIPKGIDPNKVTTGIVFNTDGSISHIPTEVFEEDGTYYARLKSLTNSIYGLINNNITVESVKGHWSESAVNNLASRLIIKKPESFNPQGFITRGEFAEYITKALGINKTDVYTETFSDITANHELADAITIASKYGIINGYSDGTFKAEKSITRQEAMAMYARAMKIVKLVGTDTDRINNYVDFREVSDWAKEDVKACVSAIVFNGKSKTTLDPLSVLTYSESVKAIENLLIKARLINL